MVNYRLHYFFSRGLGEVGRQLFHLGGIPYEDVRYSREQWPLVKEDFPFNQVPVLEVDGVFIPQSLAVYRYIAKQTGHYGKDDLEAGIIDALADLYKDYFKDTLPYYLSALEIFPETEEYVKAKYEELVVPARVKFFTFLTLYLQKSKTGYLAGGDLSFVDLIVAEHISTFRQVLPDYTAGFPEIEANVEKVRTNPKLKEWLEERPVTNF